MKECLIINICTGKRTHRSSQTLYSLNTGLHVMWKRCLSLFVLEINDPVGGNSFGPVRCLQIGTTRESQLSYGDNSISIPFAIKTRFLLVEIRKVSTYYESVLLHLHFGLDGRPSLSLPNNTPVKNDIYLSNKQRRPILNRSPGIARPAALNVPQKREVQVVYLT